MSSAIEASHAKITEKVSTGLDDLITSFFMGEDGSQIVVNEKWGSRYNERVI